VRAVDASLKYLAITLSEQFRAMERAGIEPVAEIYADRGYSEKGSLIPRGQQGAMIEDPDEAADRVVRMVEAGAVITASGARLKAPIESVCVHGDSPHAVESARRVREKLESAGIKVAPFSKV
jgi:UPF0271 protein